MYRTHTCGELSLKNIGETVTMCGWIQTIRKFGAIVFIDLRDRYGITQLLIQEEKLPDLPLSNLGREFVIQISGQVAERSNKNLKIPTGEIEVIISELKIMSPSAIPPFTIQDDTDGGEDIRMKFRYLDLRRATMQKNVLLRYKINKAVRAYLDQHHFLDIETPFLIKSTPEGARDFVVPSRLNQHQFYALPQSPQTFKQLLMVSGFDRYFQIVKCFRDEDLRADRQPEFTQIDCEMSFVKQEDILNMFENLIKAVIKSVKNIEILDPLPRLSWEEAMWFYGNDKPDLRFDLKIINFKKPNHIFLNYSAASSIVKKIGFKVFEDAETIVAIAIPGAGDYSRKQMDELTEWVKRPQIGMQGMAYIKLQTDGQIKSSFEKFCTPDTLKDMIDRCKATPGSLILILAGKEEKTRKAMSELRLEMASKLGLRNPNTFKLAWILDFPLFEYDAEENRWVARHHPFTSPKPEDISTMLHNEPQIANPDAYLEHPYYNIKANAYDMVLNGNEIGGGSIRIFQKELQEKMFAALGMQPEEYQHKFGFLLNAFEYGVPPHGGIAFGLDRICSILGGSDTIRDFIAFPKNNSGRDLMLDSPSTIDSKQLTELFIQLKS